MPCCLIAAAFLATFVVRWDRVKAYLGFEVTDRNAYGWNEYCELDEYAD
ncbi:MAG: hypothetical protein LBC65_05670 [Oscillospiraceae bacterium]|jgi:hypothetical protein|nr:hypothetical protein [Oscillospiraceae bacterium]